MSEPLSDDELDAVLAKASEDLESIIDRHFDVDAGLADVYRRAAESSRQPT